MKKRAIIIWIVVLILIILALIYFVPKFTGKAVVVNFLNDTRYICSDTDEGRDYFVQGTIQQGDVEKGTDYCTSEVRLKEYYCLGRTSTNHYYYICPYKCIDGACVEEEVDLGPPNIEDVEEEIGEIQETKPNFFQSIINWFKK
tara:strand:+ start:224 stop:655 length:432 start_codon:yes stop_codon:yes gene_type:complete